MDLLEGWDNFLPWEAHGANAEMPYPVAADILGPLRRVHLPRAPRMSAPGGTVHGVARCNNRELYFTTPEDFELLLTHLRELRRTYEVTLFAYALMANHVHLLLQAPTRGAPRPLGAPGQAMRDG